ncbi:MAG: PIG-L deacetylase family protein [Thermoanaerobaculia bacterium]
MFLASLLSLLTVMLLSPARGETMLSVYPQIARAGQQDRILIVAPHIDDEAIGAGGFAADAIANGAEVYVAFLTAGDCNRFSARLLNNTLGPTTSDYLSVGRTRIAEAKTAMKLLGVPADHYFILGYPDRGLRPIFDKRHDVIRSRGTGERSVPYADAMSPGSPYSFGSLMNDLESVVEIAQPTIVIAPVSFDLHPDHATTAQLTDEVLNDLSIRPERLGYLVHSTRIPRAFMHTPTRALVPPARMRDYTWVTYPLTPATLRAKDAVLSTYKSQRPYTTLLRNAFIRSNELFLVYPSATTDYARLPIAR